MEELAEKIANIVKDYRNDDGIQMTPDTVLGWVSQFEQEDQQFILEELRLILKRRYLSKKDVQKFLGKALKKLQEDYDYDSIESFLEDTMFLDLQEREKSQKEMLDLLNDSLNSQYSFDLSQCGVTSPKNYVYLDDILCTGNTVYYDLKEWLQQRIEGQPIIDKILEEESNVICLYVFIHTLNSGKLCWRFHFLNQNFRYKLYRAVTIQNDYQNLQSKLDFVFPIRDNQPEQVMNYFKSLNTEENGVFRDKNTPSEEKLFSSPQNRIRFENIILNKGLEILDSVSTTKANIRPLGFTLPSHKNLGFGALCFTWRNVPNNTPLVFWYSSPTWTPLFEKKQKTLNIDLESFKTRLRK